MQATLQTFWLHVIIARGRNRWQYYYLKENVSLIFIYWLELNIIVILFFICFYFLLGDFLFYFLLIWVIWAAILCELLLIAFRYQQYVIFWWRIPLKRNLQNYIKCLFFYRLRCNRTPSIMISSPSILLLLHFVLISL